MVDLKKMDEVDRVAAKYQASPKSEFGRLLHARPRPDEDGVALVCGSSMTPRPIAWIWKFWLAQGKLHVLLVHQAKARQPLPSRSWPPFLAGEAGPTTVAVVRETCLSGVGKMILPTRYSLD